MTRRWTWRENIDKFLGGEELVAAYTAFLNRFPTLRLAVPTEEVTPAPGDRRYLRGQEPPGHVRFLTSNWRDGALSAQDRQKR
jgi:hypothetical protein